MRIDVDDQTSWPAPLVGACESLAARGDPSPETVDDLDLESDNEDSFRTLLAGHGVVAYHATRLLPHEVERIRAEGLRRLTPELVADRLDEARAHGDITTAEYAELKDAHVFATGEAENRKNRLCCVLGAAAMRDSPWGTNPLLREWGGEAFSMSKRGVALRPMLGRLGSPAIVVVTLRLDEGYRIHAVYPGVQQVFVGHWAGLSLFADVFYAADLPGEHIETVGLPGDPEYDRFPDILRS
jgi:hypothetical protein